MAYMYLCGVSFSFQYFVLYVLMSLKARLFVIISACTLLFFLCFGGKGGVEGNHIWQSDTVMIVCLLVA